jgi:hypothetical protein
MFTQGIWLIGAMPVLSKISSDAELKAKKLCDRAHSG